MIYCPETFSTPTLRIESVMRFDYFHFEWNKIIVNLTLWSYFNQSIIASGYGQETGENYTQKISITISIMGIRNGVFAFRNWV